MTRSGITSRQSFQTPNYEEAFLACLKGSAAEQDDPEYEFVIGPLTEPMLSGSSGVTMETQFEQLGNLATAGILRQDLDDSPPKDEEYKPRKTMRAWFRNKRPVRVILSICYRRGDPMYWEIYVNGLPSKGESKVFRDNGFRLHSIIVNKRKKSKLVRLQWKAKLRWNLVDDLQPSEARAKFLEALKVELIYGLKRVHAELS